MIDTPNTDNNRNTPNSANTDDLRKELEKQIADLREEVTSLSATLAERGQEFYERVSEGAGEVYEGASRRARSAARQARNQAYAVSEVIKENPGTAATVLSSAGIIGFLLGLAVGQAMSTPPRSHSRWY
jgi:ElaB/YqjD/DUF883 family membrane-anchored ribosome-binding protein